jgi:hypothetical protein
MLITPFAALSFSHGSGSSIIISELREVRGEIKNLPCNAFKKPETAKQDRKTLINKINAIINQIEAEAYEGALNKLKEVNEKIKDLLLEPWKNDLKGKIEHISELVEELLPFRHGDFSLNASPAFLRISTEDSSFSVITTTSLRNFDEKIYLNVTSSPIEGVKTTLYPSEVTPPREDIAISILTVNVAEDVTVGAYTITVAGKSGALQHSVSISCEIRAPEEDTTPPTVAILIRTPEMPAYDEIVTLTAVIFDVESGVDQVILYYLEGSEQTQINMTCSGGLYKANIPAFPFDTTVQYYICALNNANNMACSSVHSYTVVDSYPPQFKIDTTSWSPKEPSANDDIQIEVGVTEPAYGSGIENVTLWFKNDTLVEWQSVPMAMKKGNWTATLRNQSDTEVTFFIEAFDKVGNRNQTEHDEFIVAAPEGFPLAWILLIVLIIAVFLIGLAAYLLLSPKQRKTEVEAVSSVKPPPPPTRAAAREPAGKVAAVRSYSMLSFIVPTHNEENTVSHRIAKVYGRAADHLGPSEIIVVDDGSDDNTYEMARWAVESNRKEWPNIRAKVVKLSASLGREEAVRLGRNRALGEVVEVING